MKKLNRNPFTRLINFANEDIVLSDAPNQFPVQVEPNRQAKRPLYHYVLGLLSLLLLVTAVWAIGISHFAKFQIGTDLVSARQSNSSLQNVITHQAQSYRLKIIYPDGSQRSYTLADMGIRADPVATVASLRQDQRQLSSRLEWWRPIPVELSLTPAKQTNAFIAQHATVTIQPAKDATISLQNGQVVETNGAIGKHYGLLGPITTLDNAAATLQPTSLRLQTLATRPAISSQQLASSQAKLKNILGQKVVFVIDNQNIRATPADIAGWLELTLKKSGKNIDVTVNSGKVLGYINKIAASSVHPPKAQVEVAHPDGTISVLVGGVSGTDVINKSDAAGDVAQKILQGKDVKEVLSVQYSHYGTITAQAYDKWIEVDTTNKRMYTYQQSTLIRTFLITAGAPLTPTVPGRFAIYAKYVQQDMSGLNVDGSSYFQPNVSWVNYFNGGDAIHGNYWRPLSYFGNINSSHGCVGIVDSDAEWIYSWAPIGTPVIVHT